MKTQVLGYPRIGNMRETKKACEDYWKGKIKKSELLSLTREQRKKNWLIQKKYGIDLIPSNDFSLYDHVLDMSLMLGVIPGRYHQLLDDKLDLYFAMARGCQQDEKDITAMEMTKWFDTNYHYIVPEFIKDQKFELFSEKAIEEFLEAKEYGIVSKPVLIGPISYLLLGKVKGDQIRSIELLDRLLPVYSLLLKKLEEAGAEYIQIDEPYLVSDLDLNIKALYEKAFSSLKERNPNLKLILASYFGSLGENLYWVKKLPVDVLHIDLSNEIDIFDSTINDFPSGKDLSLGLINGRNIWINDMKRSTDIVRKALKKLDSNRIIISTSCSLLHVPYDFELEKNNKSIPAEIRSWFAFAKQKVEELSIIVELFQDEPCKQTLKKFNENINTNKARTESKLIHKKSVKEKLKLIRNDMFSRKSSYQKRQIEQQKHLNLPYFPTTTIGSFPQTNELRKLRKRFKNDEISNLEYSTKIKKEIDNLIEWQESIGLDIFVHGEYERNDMVEYFAEYLDGFIFMENGWVQSYGSRAVKPPVIYADIERKKNMTVDWISYAQSKSEKPVKGMLTGPVTMLKWSFVRDDQNISITAKQMALAIREEVLDLEKAGIRIIQIDEPAFREGLPIHKSQQANYLKWAIDAFRLSSSVVSDKTQIHSHMCYSEFNELLEQIIEMDVDVISIESSRSEMDLLDAFRIRDYPNEIGPGIYDIHSPRVPGKDEMKELAKKALAVLDLKKIWINPDCGLKTRGWKETEKSLRNMVTAAIELREEYGRA